MLLPWPRGFCLSWLWPMQLPPTRCPQHHCYCHSLGAAAAYTTAADAAPTITWRSFLRVPLHLCCCLVLWVPLIITAATDPLLLPPRGPLPEVLQVWLHTAASTLGFANANDLQPLPSQCAATSVWGHVLGPGSPVLECLQGWLHLESSYWECW